MQSLLLPHQLATRRLKPALQQPHGSPQHDAAHQPVLFEAMPGHHHQARGCRQCIAHLGKELFKLRNDEAQHGDDGQHRHPQQDAGVDDRRHHAFAQRTQALQVLDQALHHRRHLAAGLARADHIDVKIAKQGTVFGQGLAEGHAPLDIVQHALEQRLNRGLAGHLDHHPQGVVQRQARFQHDGQLGSQRQHIRLPDRATDALHLARGRAARVARGLRCPGRGGVFYGQRREAAVAQRFLDQG